MVDNTLALRWGKPADAELIAAYHHACWQQVFAPLVSAEVMAGVEPRIERWNEWLADGSDFTTVVTTDEDDKPIGHTTVRDHELIHLFIDPEHHGKGMGRELLAIGERLIRQSGHNQAQLHTVVGNVRAIDLYQSCGWVLTDELEDDHLPNGSSYTEHIMHKDFDDPGHVGANRQTWDEKAPNFIESGRRAWAADASWGEMGVSESEIGALPPLAGRDVLELGCGTGYVSAWCLRAGAASAVGLDNSWSQLRSAQILQQENDMVFPLVWSDAERLPFADDSFDVAINEYGAGMWCDPDCWIPEAARVLRPGGSLMFLTWSTLISMAAPDFEAQRTSTQLLRPQRDLERVMFPDTDGVEFVRSHGEWIELLTANGFVVDRLIELYAPEESPGGPDRYSYCDAAWARQWPPEEIWCATAVRSAH
jgi:SAM-dependent methyltransferase/GNAT superfamily N-acetyltransferase